MSGEFGEWYQGYFSERIARCAEDCKGGQEEITRLWGEFLTDFADIAHSIAWCEACDSGVDYPILQGIMDLPKLKKRLADIERYLQSYREVAEEAVRQAMTKRSTT